jgi:hypothetical protein
MTPPEVLGSLALRRVRAAPNAGKLSLDPIAAVPADLLEQIKAKKPEILALLEQTKTNTPWQLLIKDAKNILDQLERVKARDGADFAKIRVEADHQIVHSSLIVSDVAGIHTAARDGFARYPYAFHLRVWAVKPPVDNQYTCILLTQYGTPLPSPNPVQVLYDGSQKTLAQTT